MFRRIIKRSTVFQVCSAYMLLVTVMNLFNFQVLMIKKIEKENRPIEPQSTTKMGIFKDWKTSASDDQVCGYQVWPFLN